MKVLYFYQYFGTPRGSWSTRVYEFARRWVRAGHSVTVVTSPYDKSDIQARRFLDQQEFDGIDVRIIRTRNSNRDSFLTRLLSFLVYAVVSSIYAVTLKADVVIASSGPLFVGIPGLLAKWIRGRTFVFEVRDLWPEGAIQLGILRHPLLIRLARAFEQLCYRQADLVIALSPGMADWIKSTYGINGIEVIPNASDNQFSADAATAEPPGFTHGKHLVLYTGSLGLMNDPMHLVHLAKVLQDRNTEDVELIILGDGSERPAMGKVIGSSRLTNIRLLGNRPKTEVFLWLAHAKCALLHFQNLPFLSTSSPNKIFDAFAAGVPLIQTTQGWIKAMLEESQAGITVPPDDPEALADAVIAIVRHPDRQATLSTNARRLAQTRFDRDHLAQRFCRILEQTHASRFPTQRP